MPNWFEYQQSIHRNKCKVAVEQLEKVRLKPLQEASKPLSGLIVYTKAGPIYTFKDPLRAMRAVELASIPTVNLSILNLVQRNIKEIATLSSIIIDGRQAHLLAENSILRDAAINDEARHALTNFIIDTTNLNRSSSIEAVEQYLNLSI